MSYLILDLETTTHTSYKRKANPFSEDNHVVMAGWRHRGADIDYAYYGRNVHGADNLLAQLLNDKTQLIVGHNVKFDILHLIHRSRTNRKAWMRFVARGGNVWDTQLAEYLLNGMNRESHMLALDEVAPVYGGNCKFDEVKALWAAGVDTVDINRDMLARYLVGGADEYGIFQHGDIGNTEKIFVAQLDRARKVNQVKSLLLNMGSLCCTIEMELNGMKVDKELGLRLAAELAIKLEATKLELAKYLPKDLPFEFKWSSRQQLSAFIFGGKVRYPMHIHQCDELGKPAYAQMDERQYKLTNGTLIPMSQYDETPHLFEVDRFAGGKNKGEIKSKLVKVPDLSKPKMKYEDFYYEFPRMTDPKREWEGAVEGVYSVGAEVIKELGNRDIPFLKALSEMTGMAKDLGTYYIVTDEETGVSKGMLTLVQPDGIIHHSLNHTSTVTGRFSSSSPNLQNVPKEGKSLVKTVFISRFLDGKIIQSDFSALEVYVQAILTSCLQLIEDLKAGLDMHCVRVAQKEGMSYEEVFRLAKTEAIPEWDTKRTKAKVFSFQRAYGAGAAKIAESTGMPIAEVEALIAAELARYPEIDAWYEQVTQAIKANRKATSKFIPHPTVRGAMCQLGKSSYRTPDNKLYSYEESPSPDFLAKRGTLSSFSPTEIKNYVVQGMGGEWAKAAMWLAVRYFYEQDNFGDEGLLVNQVHDALYADSSEPKHNEVASALHACMEAASEFMEYWFGFNVPVPVPSDTVCGANMMAEGKIKLTSNTTVRQWLRTNYMANYFPSFERA